MRIPCENGFIDLDALNARPASKRGPVCAVYSDYSWNNRAERTALPADQDGPVGLLTDDNALVLYSDLAFKCVLDMCVGANVDAVQFLIQEFARGQDDGSDWILEHVPEWSPLKRFLAGMGVGNVLLPPAHKVLADNIPALREVPFDQELERDRRWNLIGRYLYLGSVYHSVESMTRCLTNLFKTLSPADLNQFLDRFYDAEYDYEMGFESEVTPETGVLSEDTGDMDIPYIPSDDVPSVHTLDDDYIVDASEQASLQDMVSDEDIAVTEGSVSELPESEQAQLFNGSYVSDNDVDAGAEMAVVSENGVSDDSEPVFPDDAGDVIPEAEENEGEPVSPDDAGEVVREAGEDEGEPVSPDEAGDVVPEAEADDGEPVSPDEAGDVIPEAEADDGEPVSPDEACDDEGEPVSPDEAGDVIPESNDDEGEPVSPDEAGDDEGEPVSPDEAGDDEGEPVSPDEAGDDEGEPAGQEEPADVTEEPEQAGDPENIQDNEGAVSESDQAPAEEEVPFSEGSVVSGGDDGTDENTSTAAEEPEAEPAEPVTDVDAASEPETPAAPEPSPEPPMPTVEDMLKESRLRTLSAGDILGRDLTYASGYFEDAYDRELEKADSDGFLEEMVASRVNGTAAPIDLMSETLAKERERKISDLSRAIDLSQGHDPRQRTTQLGRKLSELREQLDEQG